MSNARSRKRRAAMLAPVAAAFAGLALFAQPASAAKTTSSDVFEFAPFGGEGLASCTITYTAEFPYGGVATQGRATTTVSGANPACTSGVTTTTAAEYRDTNDVFVTQPYTYSFGAAQAHTYTAVKRDFQTYHQVYFPACGCATQVYTLSTPNPK
jgi:hypothetical protein